MKIIELTDNEIAAMKIVLYAEYAKYRDRVGHAASHGDEYQDTAGNAIGLVINKLEAVE